VRRAVLVDGKSWRAVAREFGLARKTVGKMLEYSLPPGCRRQKPIQRPKLGPWQGVVDAILEEDKQRPKKQRHTAKRIFERLRGEYECTGGYTIVKDYVRQSRVGGQEMFVPLSHAPGEAQADPPRRAVVVIAGMECKAHFMAFDLPHSDDCFVQAYPQHTAVSASATFKTPSSIRFTTSRYSAACNRFATWPTTSLRRWIGFFPMEEQNAMTCLTASGDVFVPATISTNGIKWGGLKGCPIRQRSGCLHADCIALMVNPDELDARIESTGAASSKSAIASLKSS